MSDINKDPVICGISYFELVNVSHEKANDSIIHG